MIVERPSAPASMGPDLVPLPSPAAAVAGRGRPSAATITAAVACLLVLLGALVLAGGRPAPSAPGLPDAGPVTGWALPLVRLVFDLAAVATVGTLLLAVVLLPPLAPRLSDVATSAVRSAAWTSGLWSTSAVLLLVLTASESAGLPLGLLTAQDLGDHAAGGRGRALVLVAVLAGAAALGCARAGTVTGARRLLTAAGLGLLPTTLTGHAASTTDHELAVSSLVVHVVAATVWVGGLLAVLLLVRRPLDLARAVSRFSIVALACFVLVALSGLLSAWERLGLTATAWTSGYGALLLAKTVALVVLGAMGWQHRRRLVPALAQGRPGAFLSFAGAEVAVMAGAFALAVALSRTPTPAPTSPAPAAAVPTHGGGHETLPTVLDPVSLSGLLLEWRVNAVVLAVIGLLAAAYAGGVRRVRAEGTSWPRHRSWAFAGGLGAAVLVLSSGVATYAAAVLSVQVAQFLVLLVVVPGLLVAGAPLSLLAHARARQGPADGEDAVPSSSGRAASGALTDPLVSMVLLAGLLFAVYRTGLLDRALGSSALFLLLNTAALAVGWLLLWPALDPEPGVRRRGAGDRVAPLLAAALGLLLLAAELRFSDQLLAGRWFAELGWSWIDPAADRRLAASFAAGAAALLLVLASTAWRADAPVATGREQASR